MSIIKPYNQRILI